MPLAATRGTLRATRGARVDAGVRVAQQHLVCDGLLDAEDVDGRFGPGTARALTMFARRTGAAGDGALDDTMGAALALPSDEQDLRLALRVLRVRVADAAVLIEDGTAAGVQALVADRALDPPRVAPDPALPAAAPDLVGAATDQAAFVHERVVVAADGSTSFVDEGVRTHGTAALTSVEDGWSHGCHRLDPRLALRLASFLLAQRAHERRGPVHLPYARTLRVGGAAAFVIAHWPRR